jgi:hypothetical protein
MIADNRLQGIHSGMPGGVQLESLPFLPGFLPDFSEIHPVPPIPSIRL